MIIRVDTREKPEHRWSFSKFLEDNESVVIGKVDQGDYVIDGNESLIAIERKHSIEEVSLNFTSGKKRFKKELDRLKENHKFSCVVCEFTIEDVLRGTRYSKVSPNYILSAMMEAEYQYKIPFHMIGKGAEYFSYRFLRRVWNKEKEGKVIW